MLLGRTRSMEVQRVLTMKTKEKIVDGEHNLGFRIKEIMTNTARSENDYISKDYTYINPMIIRETTPKG